MNPIIALIIANIIWGAASPIFKFALTDIPPFTLAFIRFYFAGLLFLPFVSIDALQKASRRDWTEMILGALFGITINISFFFLGLEKTESINAPIIGSTGPIFLFIFSILFLREKLNMKVLAGMMIAFIGVWAIIFAPVLFDGRHMEGGQIQGNLLILAATMGSVMMPVAMKNVLRKIDPVTVTCVTFLFSALTFFPMMVGELRHWSITSLAHPGWIGILFGVFLCSAIGYYLYFYGLAHIAAQETGLFTYIDPVAAIVIAGPLLHEYPTLIFFAGSALIFGGIYFAEGRFPYHPLMMLRGKIKK